MLSKIAFGNPKFKVIKLRFNLSVWLVIAMWIVILMSKYFMNGLSFGFDYGVFQPDGANYYYRTLTFLNIDPYSAANKVADWYLTNGFKHNVIDPMTLLPENNPVWYLSAPRVVYPFLSMPFVYFFGAYGMLVIPSIALLGLMLTVNWIAWRYRSVSIGFLFNFVLTASPTVSRWFIADITDGLLAFLVGLFAIICIKRLEISKVTNLILTAILILISSATRFSLPIWISIAIAFLLLKLYAEAITIFVTSVVGAIPLLYFGVNSAILPSSNSQSLVSKFVELPINSFKVFSVEFIQLLILDKLFLVTILVGIYAAWKLRKTFAGLIVLSVFMGVLLIGFINGTLGVNFRYQLPLLVFLFWATIEWLDFKKFQDNSS